VRVSNIAPGDKPDDRLVYSPITPSHVHAVRQVGLSDEDKVAVISQAAKEGLTVKQTRLVAEAVKRTQDPEAKSRARKGVYSVLEFNRFGAISRKKQ
jgi:hypothetical protein